MSPVWWDRRGARAAGGRMVPGIGPAQSVPELVAATRDAVMRAVRQHISAYTPEWRANDADDAGQAFIGIFGDLMESVLQRVNRLPERLFVDFLNIANVQPIGPTPAKVLLQFTVSDSARTSAVIPAGFQVGAKPADGGDLVIFETDRTISATSATLAEIHVEDQRRVRQMDGGIEPDPAFSFRPFGNRPRLGNGVYLGFAGAVAPGPTISLAIHVVEPPGIPLARSAGGVAPLPGAPAPTLQWEVFDQQTFVAAEVLRDETGGLMRTGIVELRLPVQWRPDRPRAIQGKAPLRWLRIRIASAVYGTLPAVAWIIPNAVRATAGRTIRNDVLEPVASADHATVATYRLSQQRVLADTLILEVAEGGFEDSGDAVPAADATDVPAPSAGVRRWRRVDDLSAWGPDDEVFVLDALNGLVKFGNGRHGAMLPQGFRHVRALRYRVGGGANTAVDAGAATMMRSSVPSVTGVTNPLRASGGSDEESSTHAMRRGPEEIRARGRAVTVADYALMAERSEGASVARAMAAAGVHPSFPGVPIPGIVGVFVVSRGLGDGPPVPSEDDLRGVAESLSTRLAPAGVEVVAAAPKFRRVRVEAGIVVDPAFDAASAVAFVLDTLNRYLHPLTGGEDGAGWPFGAPIVYIDLLTRLVAPELGIRAVPRLTLVVDGRRQPRCADVLIGPYELFWPGEHEVVPIGVATS